MTYTEAQINAMIARREAEVTEYQADRRAAKTALERTNAAALIENTQASIDRLIALKAGL